MRAGVCVYLRVWSIRRNSLNWTTELVLGGEGSCCDQLDNGGESWVTAARNSPVQWQAQGSPCRRYQHNSLQSLFFVRRFWNALSNPCANPPPPTPIIFHLTTYVGRLYTSYSYTEHVFLPLDHQDFCTYLFAVSGHLPPWAYWEIWACKNLLSLRTS